MTINFTLNIQPLLTYARDALKCPATLWTLATSTIEGGFLADRLYRHDLVFRLDDGSCETLSVVQKFASAAEVQTMQALAGMSRCEALSHLIDCSKDLEVANDQDHWFIVPFHEGTQLTFADEVPAAVVRSLAHVHAHFASNAEQLGWLPRLDAGFFAALFDNTLQMIAVEIEQQEPPDSRLVEAQRRLLAIYEEPVLTTTLELLPVTLVHGDVHPGNIIQLSDEGAILLDWGNARIAPAMLDLANTIELGSDNWQLYLSTWETLTGLALDPDLARLGYHWATVTVNVMYLPYAAKYWRENVPGMVERLEEAVESICISCGRTDQFQENTDQSNQRSESV